MNKPLLIKIVIIALPVALVCGLLWNYLGLSGVKTVHYTVGDSSPFIQSLLPDERVGDVEGGAVKLLDEPVYFSVFAPPGNWQTADVSVAFNAGSKAVLELGALKDLFAQAFDFRPLANTVLDNLENDGWVKMVIPQFGAGISVFARPEVANGTVQPQNSEFAVYKAQLPWAPPSAPAKLAKGYGGSTFSYPLNGPLEFFTYKYDSGPSVFELNYFDQNKAAGSDEITVRVYNQQGEILAQVAAPDDGDVLADNQASGLTEFPKMPPLFEGLPQGVYRVVVSATSDIWFQDIKTPSPYLAFKNSLTVSFPTCAAARPAHDCDLALNTNAKAITIQPLDADALAPVTFGVTSVTLDEVNTKIRLKSADRELSPLIIGRQGKGGTFKITGEGFFSLATAPFFTPEPAGFSNFVAAPEDFRVVVANVPEANMDGAWRVGSSTFDLSTLAKERGAYKFVLSAPLIHESGGDISVHGIDITFRKPPLTFHSFLSALKSFVKQLI